MGDDPGMGFFEDMFHPDFMFDTEYKQRRDLEALRQAVANDPTPAQVAALRAQVEQLRLLTSALSEMLIRKGVASREELEVLVQQIDLLDGAEDGAIGAVRRSAPRCRSCDHFVNPRRDACIYCGTPIPRSEVSGGSPYRGGRREAPPRQRMATCGACGTRVPQTETYFTETGALVCTSCHA
jgi:hypothetical protein